MPRPGDPRCCRSTDAVRGADDAGSPVKSSKHVRVNIARRNGRVTNIAPEYEDCREIALASGVPLKDVYDEAKAAVHKAYPKGDEPGEPSSPADDRA